MNSDYESEDDDCTIKKTSDMDDIHIIFFKNSHTVTLWVDYITSYFKQPGGKQMYTRPFKVKQIALEDVVETNGDVRSIAEKTANVKLQVVVICPNLLEHISLYPEPAKALGKLLLPGRTLALLLGVTEDEVKEEHKRVFPTYSQWQRLAVGQDQDESFTKEFLSTAMGIVLKIWKQQSSILIQEKAQFSVAPKKIRQGQNSFIIMLTYPLQKEDVIKVSIERNNDLTEIKSVKRRNPYVLKVNVPEFLTDISAIVNVLVEKNGSIIGTRPIKCESKLRELEQILRSVSSPVEFMCQTLGFNPQNKEQLDNYLVHALQKNLPPNFNLLSSHSNVDFNFDSKFGMCEEFPTLLHFAAKFGLEKLSMLLLDCPGGDLACEIRNNNDMNPSEIAFEMGHINLSHILKGYMKMNELTSVYAKLKEITENVDKPFEEDDPHYLSPKNVENFYKICPPPRPVNLNATSPSTERSVGPSFGYLAMKSSAHTKHDVTNENKNASKTKCSQESINSQSQTASSLSNTCSSKMNKSKNSPVFEDKVQKELLEIINDFKNNVHSIAQAEKLVEEWKNRNDVIKSFKEKQEQLHELRIKYDRMQQDIKKNYKLSPFERMKKLFAWNSAKNKDEEGKYESSTPCTSEGAMTGNRPISSLSLQSTSSSGSSGRMSTISGCSMGDSGTHSDHDERKITTPIDDDFKNELSKFLSGPPNYMIPPTPKPVKAINKCPTIEERPPQPTPRPDADQYYIQFPPSGMPVSQAKNNNNVVDSQTTETEYLNLDDNTQVPQQQQPMEQYMNFPIPLESPSTNTRESPEYMNVPI